MPWRTFGLTYEEWSSSDWYSETEEQVRLGLWDWGNMTSSLIYNGSNPWKDEKRRRQGRKQTWARHRWWKGGEEIKKTEKKEHEDWKRLLNCLSLRFKRTIYSGSACFKFMNYKLQILPSRRNEIIRLITKRLGSHWLELLLTPNTTNLQAWNLVESPSEDECLYLWGLKSLLIVCVTVVSWSMNPKSVQLVKCHLQPKCLLTPSLRRHSSESSVKLQIITYLSQCHTKEK